MHKTNVVTITPVLKKKTRPLKEDAMIKLITLDKSVIYQKEIFFIPTIDCVAFLHAHS